MRKLRNTIVLLALLAPVTTAQSSSARDRAMGGTGVASSHPFTSIFVNPALLTRASDELDFGLVLPYFEIGVADEDELIDGVDEFQDTLTEIQDLINASDFVGANALRPTLASQLSGLDQRGLDFSFNANIGVVIPADGLKLGVGVQNYIDGRAFVRVDPADIAVINNPTGTSADLDNLQSEAVAVAAGITEIGLSAAADVELFGFSVALGVTPKYQAVRTFNYAVQVNQFDEDDSFDDFEDDIYRTEDSGVNLDLGAAISVNDRVTIGLAIKNVIAESYDTVLTNGVAFQYEIEPQATIGVGFKGAGFSLAVDLDVMKLEGFEGLEDTQLVRVGGEYDAGGWAQLRAGYVHDLEDGTQDLLSAGIGLSPFQVVRLDFVAFAGDNAYGGGFQLAFTL